MSLKRLLILIATLLVVLAADIVAQDTCYASWTFLGLHRLDLGYCDTVRLGCSDTLRVQGIQEGDSIPLPIYLWNDYPIGGFSLGFTHGGNGIRFGADWEISDSSVIPAYAHVFQTPTKISSHGDSVLIGWVDMTADHPIPPTPGNKARLLGYLYLKFEELIPQTMTIDSAWIPPAGNFELSAFYPPYGNTFALTPRLSRCNQMLILFEPLCGDVDHTNNVDVADAVSLVNYLFGSSVVIDSSAGDVDCSGRLNIADVVYLINYIFLGGQSPCRDCP